MYTGSPFESDLINSYAWDTATLFLQTFGTTSQYSRQTSLNTSLENLGTNKTTNPDVVCNIYDMASNCYEESTETSQDWHGACTGRSGGYGGNSYTSYRSSSGPTYKNADLSFRPILYL